VLESGIDNRKELNLTVTGLGQLLFLPALGPLFPPSWPRAEVAAALIAFMDAEWQDPATGYWGAWYQVGEKLIKTEDLSITFHIASYRDGKIAHLGRLVRTTGRIRERIYPYGWQDRGTQNCHHASDVVRLVRFGWPHMENVQQAFARSQLMIILARTLRLSINAVGQVDSRPYNRIAEAYYFCASLLDELGYFRSSQNFWSTLTLAEAETLRLKLLEQLERLPPGDPMIDAARRKLVERDPVGSAQAGQGDRSRVDPEILALLFGVASIAVDSEAAALRINDLADQLADLERRLAQRATESDR
jgi:hypothetical protein